MCCGAPLNTLTSILQVGNISESLQDTDFCSLIRLVKSLVLREGINFFFSCLEVIYCDLSK